MDRMSWLVTGFAAATLLCACEPTPSATSGRPSGLRLTTTDDLHGRRIGVIVGSAHDTYATGAYPDATIAQYQTAADLLLAVMTGKVDAGLADAEPLAEIMRQNPDIAVLGEPLFAATVAAGFRKGDDEIRERFNDFLQLIRQNGVYDDMAERWFRLNDARMPAVEAARAEGELVIGTSVGSLPFGATVNGEPVGFDIELGERFAAHLGKRAVFSDMPFAGLIAALAAGKIEVIVANMFDTEERRQRIDFSAPYFETQTKAYVLRQNLGGDSDSGLTASQDVAGTPLLGRIADSFRSNIVREKRYLLVWKGLTTTLQISLFATILGTLLGALICFLRMSKVAALNSLSRAYIALLRGLPVLVLLMLIFYVVFASVNISPILVAIIAFGMNFAAYAAEIYRSGIEGVDTGQSEAGIAMGFTRLQAFLYIVLPQMVRRILPVYKGEVISLVKMTSIVGYIAVQDLTKASDIIRSRTFDPFFPLLMAALLYFLIAVALVKGLEYVERRTDPKVRRARAASP